MRGSPKAYLKLKEARALNNDTLYFIYMEDSDDGELYLGEKLIAGLENLSSLSDIEISNANLADKQILMYDIGSQKWVNATIEEAITSVFVGATENSAGVAGLVPPPNAGAKDLFLRSDGSWAQLEGAEISSTINIENVNGLEGYLTEQHFHDKVNNKLNFITQVDSNIFSVKDQTLIFSPKVGRLFTDHDETQLHFIEAVDSESFDIRPITEPESGKNKNTLILKQITPAALMSTLGNLKALPKVTLSNGAESNNLVDNVNYLHDLMAWKEI